MDETFATPEEAAVVEFPTRYVRVEGVSYSSHGRHAKVLLLTNEEPYLYPYFVYCERDENGRWHEASLRRWRSVVRVYPRTLVQARLTVSEIVAG